MPNWASHQPSCNALQLLALQLMANCYGSLTLPSARPLFCTLRENAPLECPSFDTRTGHAVVCSGWLELPLSSWVANSSGLESRRIQQPER
jgi:hypothetical protein